MFEYTSDTGKYKGIIRQNTFAGFASATWPVGTTTGYGTWNR
jgi:hypothetical protein